MNGIMHLPKKKLVVEVVQQDDNSELDKALSNTGVGDKADDDDNDNITSKSGVGVCTNDSTSNSTHEADKTKQTYLED